MKILKLPATPTHLWVSVNQVTWNLTWGGVEQTTGQPPSTVLLMRVEVDNRIACEVLSRVDAIARLGATITWSGIVGAIWGRASPTCTTFIEAVLGIRLSSTIPTLVDWGAVREELYETSQSLLGNSVGRDPT